MKIKTSELSGVALNLMVAAAIGAHAVETGSDDLLSGKHWSVPGFPVMRWDDWTPSTDWSQGGPLIDRFAISLHSPSSADNSWLSFLNVAGFGASTAHGDTPLIAAMRAIVAAKLGDEVDVPEGLV